MTANQTPTDLASLREAVHQALKLYYNDDSYDNPLAHLHLVRRRMDAGEGSRKAANQILLQALDTLAQRSPDLASILRERFLNQVQVYVLANQRNVAEPTIYRRQDRGLDLLAEIVAEQEAALQDEHLRRMEARLDPPSHSRLFGLDDHLARLGALLSDAKPPFLVGLVGLGGIGKTTLADALLRQLLRSGQIVEMAWVSAKQQIFSLDGNIGLVGRPALTSETLLAGLAAQVFADKTTTLPSERASEILQAELSHRPHLLVVDNLETVADLRSLLPTLRRLAGPSKILLTARHSLAAEPDLYHFLVPELAPPTALALIRHEAARRNQPEVAEAPDAALRPIVDAVGGNPLALHLVAGQLYHHGLDVILADLAQARGRTAENLYSFIYRWAWDSLDEPARRTLLAMPLASDHGGSLDFLAELSELDAGALRTALDRLVALNLVQSRGGLLDRRYTIHNLTRSFLQEQVAQWPQT